jgi:hypothetical protein
MCGYTLLGVDGSDNSILGCRFLERSIHALYLVIRPRMFGLGQPLSERVFITYMYKAVFEDICIVFPICRLDATIASMG